MIERRSRLAFEGYSQSLEAGVPVDQAIRVADRILFRGLLFSPYDTVHLILETDYPAIPPKPASDGSAEADPNLHANLRAHAAGG